MTASIDVIYTRKALGIPPGSEGYINKIKINTETTPDELEKCLVFEGNAVPESFNRVADLSDISSVNDSPPPLNLFSSISWNPFSVGDVIKIFLRPVIWENSGVIPNKTYTVTSVVGTAGQVSETFPSYEEDVWFTVTRSGVEYGVYQDGIATRDYTSTPTVNEFRVSEYVTWFQNKSDAETELDDIKIGLQDLADEYNLDYFEQDEWNTYTGDLGSQLKIRFLTEQLSTDEYFIQVEVDLSETTSDLEDCIVFRRELGSERELLVRIATLEDLQNVSNTAPSLTEFRSNYFIGLPGESIATGDVINITGTIAPFWSRVSGPLTFTVGTLPSDPDPTIAPVSGIPAYENRHEFTIYRDPDTYPSTGTFTGGISGRNVDTSVLYYRTNLYQTAIMSLLDAINLIDALKEQAESLVTAYDSDDYTGTDTEIYT